MRHRELYAITIVAVLSQVPFSVEAFECPKHFAEAQAAIDKATDSVKKMTKGGMPIVAISHLRDARTSLREAEYHHGQSNNVYHTRAIIRAGEAQSHALVAYIVSQGAKNE
jgi:hypothetical protein